MPDVNRSQLVYVRLCSGTGSCSTGTPAAATHAPALFPLTFVVEVNL